MGIVRTSLAMGSMIPAAWAGVLTGATNQSWTDGVNSMMATFGDLGTAMAGLKSPLKERKTYGYIVRLSFYSITKVVRIYLSLQNYCVKMLGRLLKRN